mmetsp:Transcript_21911/g.62603  ORF Transcript_21911/g.62603 Transcript_21911/m.62603 type:complete len:352 (-) Transcript_21911:239-1294(-)
MRVARLSRALPATPRIRSSSAADHFLKGRQPLLELADLGVLPHLLLTELLLIAQPALVGLDLAFQLVHLPAQAVQLLSLFPLLLLVLPVILAQLRQASGAQQYALVLVLLVLGEAFRAQLRLQLGDLLQQLLHLLGRRGAEARGALVVLRDLGHKTPLPLAKLLRLRAHAMPDGLLRRQEGPGEGVKPGFQELQVELCRWELGAVAVLVLQLLPEADHFLRQTVEFVKVGGALRSEFHRLRQFRLEPRGAAAPLLELIFECPRLPGRRAGSPRRLFLLAALLQALQRCLGLGREAGRLLRRQRGRGHVVAVLAVRRPHATTLSGGFGAEVPVLRREPPHHEACIDVTVLQT